LNQNIIKLLDLKRVITKIKREKLFVYSVW